MFKHYYLSFKGRCRRREYWLFGVVPTLLLWLPIIILARRAGFHYLGVYVLSLIVMWPLVMMQAKRFHDLDISGWICLLNLLPLADKVMMIVVGVIPGKPSENRFGPGSDGQTPVVSEPAKLNAMWVLMLLSLGVFAYAVFATFTGFDEFMIDARNEARWMEWRFIIFGFWLLLSIMIFIMRDLQVYAHTLWASLAIGALLFLILGAGFFGGHESIYLYMAGTAMTYVYLAGMLSLTMRNLIVSIVSIVMFIAAQLVTDIVVLAIAAQVNMRM